jgi:hypothetical protein
MPLPVRRHAPSSPHRDTHIHTLLSTTPTPHLCPVDALSLVLLLLQGEQVTRELLLQTLIRIVDAQLLKAARVCRGDR